MSDTARWERWLLEVRRRLSRANERRLVCLSGPPAWGRARAASAVAGATLWVGTRERDGVTYIGLGDAHRQLGIEFDTVVYDAHLGFCPDAFAAVAGTLRGGGLLLLLWPALRDWSDFADPRRAAYASWPAAPAAVGGRYLARLQQVLARHPGALCVPEGTALPPLPETGRMPEPAGMVPVPGCLTAGQAGAVSALARVAGGHPKRPLVLLADRGRGKSAALGIAAARELETRPERRILVTAPRRSAAATLFAHAERDYAGELADRLRYVGNAELEAVIRPGDLVLVDEAAGLPIDRLRRLVAACSRIAFATTVHGYEGAGRGFAVRFTALLDALRPQWRALWLDEPVRWSPQDPLEPLVNEALLLAAELPRIGVPGPPAGSGCGPAGGDPADGVEVGPIDRDELAGDDELLRETVALLVTAHYQTRPSDLRRLLDAPGVALWLARRYGRVVGVAWVGSEGGFDASLTDDIWHGERRPRGNLLPQVLTYHLGDRRAGACRFARIQRIVVHPELRRHGIGGRLLAAVAAWAGARAFDFVGTSFAAISGMPGFWGAADYAPVRLGDRLDDASGAYSLVMLRPVTSPARNLIVDWRARFAAQLPLALMDANRLRDCDPRLVAELYAILADDGSGGASLGAGDRAELEACARGNRQWADSVPLLRRALLSALHRDAGVRLPASECVPAIRVLLQGHDLAEVAASLGLRSRAELAVRLKNSILDWISDQ